MRPHPPPPASCYDVHVQRIWVERGEVRPAVAALQRVLADGETVHRFKGRVHLIFDGYDYDPRELWVIPEVHAYVRGLDAEFPYWLWFMAPDDPALLLLVACCCRVAAYGFHGERVSATVYPAEIAAFLDRHVIALEQLASEFGLSESSVAETAYGALDRFGVPRGRGPERN